MAGNRRRNRKRLRCGKLSERSIARHYISLASDCTIIDDDYGNGITGFTVFGGASRHYTQEEIDASEAQSQIDVLREALASAVHPEHRAYLRQLLERYSVQTSWDASGATVTHYILNHEVYAIDSESSQIMHEVEQQATLEEQGILRRWKKAWRDGRR